ncbi:MAG: BREX-1 system adenine-specific DNA-methyltransferase PglX [Sulfurospirillum sp.]|nr:BREX-1 system adenine-specific DNA-methyltransferase PglX [Sulfurospirillum sp.]
MNKSALKLFATSMRLDLIHVVKTKIDFLLSQSYKDNLALYNSNKDAITKIEERYAKEKEEFIEEIAYTWFNRLIALRFMDANGITPTSIVSTTSEHPIPKVFVEAKAGDVPENFTLNKTLFFDLIDKKVSGIKDSDNEAYKMLFIAACNHFSTLMPTMFERISDYTELLLPEDMLSQSSLRAKVVEAMSDEDCKDIEIIGWLYQFYISEKKRRCFCKA